MNHVLRRKIFILSIMAVVAGRGAWRVQLQKYQVDAEVRDGRATFARGDYGTQGIGPCGPRKHPWSRVLQIGEQHAERRDS